MEVGACSAQRDGAVSGEQETPFEIATDSLLSVMIAEASPKPSKKRDITTWQFARAPLSGGAKHAGWGGIMARTRELVHKGINHVGSG